MTIANANIIEFDVCQDEKTYPPFHLSDSQIKASGKFGLVKTKLNAAAKGLNIKINYIKLPWKRCAVMLQEGKVDALMAAVWSEKRKNWGVFPKNKNDEIDGSRKILTSHYSIFTHKDSKVSWDGKKVHNLTNGIFSPKGYVVTDMLKKLGILQRFNSNPRLVLDVVARRRIDGFVCTNRVAKNLIKLYKLEDEIVKLDLPILIDDWHIPVSHKFYKKHPKLVQSFWDNLKDINIE